MFDLYFFYRRYRAIGVIAAGQRIDCDHLIMSNEYVPDQYVVEEGKWINRAAHVVNKSILADPEGKERVSFLLYIISSF